MDLLDENSEDDSQLYSEELTEQSQIDLSTTQLDDYNEMESIKYNFPVEQMLIFSKHYRDILQKISESGYCKILLGTEYLKLCGATENQIKACFQKINQQFCLKLKKITWEAKTPRERFILLNSQMRNKIIQQNNCHLTQYRKNIMYLHSMYKTEKQLETIKQKIRVGQTNTIIWREFSFKHPINNRINIFFEKVIAFYEKDFAPKKIICQTNILKNGLYINAEDVKYRIQAKLTLKNVVKSTLVFILRVKQQPEKYFKFFNNYLAEIAPFPIFIDKLHEGLFCLITKDNLLKQLFQKSKFINAIMDMNIGMFFIRDRNTWENQQTQVQKYCEDNSYTLKENEKIFYFKKNLKQELSITAKAEHLQKFYSELINRLIKIKPVTEKFTTYKPKAVNMKQDPNKFYTLGQYKPYSEIENICSKFGCDIQMRQIFVNKQHLKKYNSSQVQQVTNQLFTKVDWCPNDKTSVCPIQRQKMEGEYFYGRIKKVNEELTLFFPEFIIKTL